MNKLSKKLPKTIDGIKIIKITPAILNDKSLINMALLIEDISDWWSTIDNFFNKGFGFTAIYEDQICGWCYSVCVLEKRAEIYIETLENFRNRGIAYAMAWEMMNFCLENKYQPEWEAWEEKGFSIRIAKNLGYELDYTYNVYEMKI